jgi:hypothetical protein
MVFVHCNDGEGFDHFLRAPHPCHRTPFKPWWQLQMKTLLTWRKQSLVWIQ